MRHLWLIYDDQKYMEYVVYIIFNSIQYFMFPIVKSK